MSSPMHDFHGRHNWIEGVGNELVYAISAFLGIFIPVIVILFQREHANVEIHPESEENVETVRQEIHHQHPEPSAPPLNIAANSGQHQCPICLVNAQYAIQTNCGHLFCGNCIVTYWRHGRWLGVVKCPCCRQNVTLLLVNFTPEEHESTTEEKQIILDAIRQYNRRFSGEPRQWMDYIRDMPTLLRHAMGEVFTVGGLVWMFRLRVLVCFLAAMLYFISPFDIIPEAAFGILGFLDDFFILLLLAIYISLVYRQIIQNRAQGNDPNQVQ